MEDKTHSYVCECALPSVSVLASVSARKPAFLPSHHWPLCPLCFQTCLIAAIYRNTNDEHWWRTDPSCKINVLLFHFHRSSLVLVEVRLNKILTNLTDMALKLEIVTLYGTICYPLSLGAPYMPGLPIRCAQHSPRCPLSWCPLAQPAQCNPTTCPLSPDQGVHSMGILVALVTMMPIAQDCIPRISTWEESYFFFSSATIHLLCCAVVPCTLWVKALHTLCIRFHKFINSHILQCDGIINVKLCNRCKYGEAHEPPRSCNHNDLPSIMVRLLVSCQAINRPILVVVISCDKARSPAIGNGRPMGLTNYVSRNLQIKTVIQLYVMQSTHPRCL